MLRFLILSVSTEASMELTLHTEYYKRYDNIFTANSASENSTFFYAALSVFVFEILSVKIFEF